MINKITFSDGGNFRKKNSNDEKVRTLAIANV